ncbi:uncharacterized protein LOC107769439 [Nicotiana tabacum]|uniref:Uncharacterized protein LOC107769439 n=1 Tax=Nicotiana tabacum TaxID=4097 RepID=A0A1S3XW25_TOBAC|nr:PREDICTED: uncharacterized protein LOC107769439 [Nicotiana tabacum]
MGDNSSVSNLRTTALDSGSTVTTLIDPSHPYYIFSCDVSGIYLVSTLFDGTGYVNWSKGMLMSLSARNKIGFIDRSCPRPSVTSPLYKAWDRCDNLVGTWILNALTTQIRNSVLHSKSAKDMWDDLRDRYSQPNEVRIYHLKKDLVGVTQGNSDIATYYSRLKKLWDELSILNSFMTCSCCDCICKCIAKGHNAVMIESDKVH